MLYDPRWNDTSSQNKPTTFSLAGLINWLEQQDPDTRYSYGDIHNCLLSTYFRAKGYRSAFCGPSDVSFSLFFLPPLFSKRIPEEMNEVAVSCQTYRQALLKAKSYIAEQR
jgi:hypothetical protein